MAKFYVYNNASRRLKFGKYTYAFDVIEQFAGAWRGVLKLEDEGAIAAIGEFGTRFGVIEISEEEYDNLLKKKLNSKPFSQSTAPQPTSSLKPADRVAIKDPSSPTTPETKIESKPLLAEAVVLGQAPFIDPLEAKNNSRRRGKR